MNYGPNCRPKTCCEMGTYECQIPMSINGRVRCIDYCISDVIAALNAANIPTLASCCGHNQIDAIISLEDGRELRISRETVVRPWEKVGADGKGGEDND